MMTKGLPQLKPMRTPAIPESTLLMAPHLVHGFLSVCVCDVFSHAFLT